MDDRRPVPVPWRGVLRQTAPLLGLCLAISVTTTAYCVEVYLPSFNSARTALDGVPRPRSSIPPTPALCRHLALVIVDGLSFDEARASAELAPLRRSGVFRPLHADFPTYTAPALTSFVTGTPPRESGIRLNGNLDRGVPDLDSIPALASAAGVPVELRTREWEPFPTLMRPAPAADVRIGRIGAFTELVTRRLSGAPTLPLFDGRSTARKLTLFYIGEVDETAHAHGARGQEFHDAVTLAGTLVRRVADTLDPDQDTMIVVSDHGHVMQGGHGGDEHAAHAAFLLATGGIIRRGVELGERPARDLASTLAVLAGVPSPGSNLGAPMLDLLALGERETAYLRAAPFDQAARLLCRLAPSSLCDAIGPLVERMRKADAEAGEEAEALHATLTASRDAAMDQDRRAHRTRRLAIFGAVVAIATLGAALVLRRQALTARLDVATLALPLVNVAAYVGVIYYGIGYYATFSGMKPGPSFGLDAMLAGTITVALCALLTWRTRPGPLAPWALLVLTLAPFAALATWVGADPVHLPPPVEGILVFELAPCVVSAAGAAALAAVLHARRGARV